MFDEFAAFEAGAGAHERDEVGCVDGPPAEGHPQVLTIAPGPWLESERVPGLDHETAR